MTATERMLHRLSGVRLTGEGRWTALCPSHRDRRPSLSVRQVGGRALVKCWANCTATEITSALGLSLADLFDNADDHWPDPRAIGRRDAMRGFQQWRDAEVTWLAAELRHRDAERMAVNAAVQAGGMTEKTAWGLLAGTNDGYIDLQYRFEVLRAGSNAEALEVYRNG